MIEHNVLKELLDYVDDKLIWKERPGNAQFNKVFAGKEAGDNQEYSIVEIMGKRIGKHRVIYAWHTGEWPEIVDHKDRDPTNYKYSNLRAATFSQNSCNQKVRSDNALGIKNIHQKPNGTFQIRITVKGKQVSGTKRTLEEAIAWRDSKLLELHGEFSSTG